MEPLGALYFKQKSTGLIPLHTYAISQDMAFMQIEDYKMSLIHRVCKSPEKGGPSSQAETMFLLDTILAISILTKENSDEVELIWYPPISIRKYKEVVLMLNEFK